MASTGKSPRGILKHSKSLDRPESAESRKAMKWDEMNILATYHPADKDYGHMKIDDPPTPYSRSMEIGEDEEGEDTEEKDTRRNSLCEEDKGGILDPEKISERLKGIDDHKIKISPRVQSEDDDEEEEDKHLTPEQLEKHKVFEQKRKLHYNEFQAVKLAKQLIAQEDEEEDEDDD